jgi:predicted Zn-dependent peptidase
VDAELAEKARVQKLFDDMKDASEKDKIKHLIDKDAADELIMEIGGISQSAIDEVKKAMEEELAEKKRKEEELAAKKAAEAAGPSLEDIDPDDMLEYIEGIREILEFSDVEKDIRTMCEQSAIPKALVDIAVSDPDKLDELENKAGG